MRRRTTTTVAAGAMAFGSACYLTSSFDGLQGGSRPGSAEGGVDGRADGAKHARDASAGDTSRADANARAETGTFCAKPPAHTVCLDFDEAFDASNLQFVQNNATVAPGPGYLPPSPPNALVVDTSELDAGGFAQGSLIVHGLTGTTGHFEFQVLINFPLDEDHGTGSNLWAVQFTDGADQIRSIAIYLNTPNDNASLLESPPSGPQVPHPLGWTPTSGAWTHFAVDLAFPEGGTKPTIAIQIDGTPTTIAGLPLSDFAGETMTSLSVGMLGLYPASGTGGCPTLDLRFDNVTADLP